MNEPPVAAAERPEATRGGYWLRVLLTGLLAPIGHGTWTAILATVLFRESGRRRFRIDGATDA